MSDMTLTLEQRVRTATSTVRAEDEARRLSSAEWQAIAKRLEERIETLGTDEPVLMLALKSVKQILETVPTGEVTWKDKIGAAKVLLDLFKYLNPMVVPKETTETTRTVTLDPAGRSPAELKFAAKYGCWPLPEDLEVLSGSQAPKALPDNRSGQGTGKVRE